MMRQTAALRPDQSLARSSRHQLRRNRILWWLVYGTALTAGLLIGAVAYKRAGQPYFGVAWGCFALLLAAWVRFPKTALAASIALTLTGDIVTVWWFPFAKNLSSFESIMYLADGVSFSPLEISVLWGLGVTAYRNLASRGTPFRSAPLVVPFAAFVGFAFMGLVRGLSRGGDSRAATLEIRPLILLPLIYLLIVNVCDSRRDYRRMYWAALAGIVVQSLLSLRYLFGLPEATRSALESLNEHGSSIGMNLLFITLIISLAYKNVPTPVRVTLLVASVPVMWVYLVAQRRSAVVALCVGFALFAVALFWRQRRTFWKVIPVVTIIAVGYLGVFWQSDSTAGFPAQAVKTVIAPGQASEADQSSDIYRQLEKLNLAYTIRRPHRSSELASAIPSIDRMHCQTSACSSWRHTFRTTRFCGSGSKQASAASSPFCTFSVGRSRKEHLGPARRRPVSTPSSLSAPWPSLPCSACSCMWTSRGNHETSSCSRSHLDSAPAHSSTNSGTLRKKLLNPPAPSERFALTVTRSEADEERPPRGSGRPRTARCLHV